MINEVIDVTKQTVQEMAQQEGPDLLQEAAKDAVKDFAKGIGENTKLDISVQGPPAAAFLSILPVCVAGTICYGIYTWGELQKSQEKKASK